MALCSGLKGEASAGKSGNCACTRLTRSAQYVSRCWKSPVTPEETFTANGMPLLSQEMILMAASICAGTQVEGLAGSAHTCWSSPQRANTWVMRPRHCSAPAPGT